jgi:ABC-type Fe3+ transport system permease subunit
MRTGKLRSVVQKVRRHPGLWAQYALILLIFVAVIGRILYSIARIIARDLQQNLAPVDVSQVVTVLGVALWILVAWWCVRFILRRISVATAVLPKVASGSAGAIVRTLAAVPTVVIGAAVTEGFALVMPGWQQSAVHYPVLSLALILSALPTGLHFLNASLEDLRAEPLRGARSLGVDTVYAYDRMLFPLWKSRLSAAVLLSICRVVVEVSAIAGPEALKDGALVNNSSAAEVLSQAYSVGAIEDNLYLIALLFAISVAARTWIIFQPRS